MLIECAFFTNVLHTNYYTVYYWVRSILHTIVCCQALTEAVYLVIVELPLSFTLARARTDCMFADIPPEQCLQ